MEKVMEKIMKSNFKRKQKITKAIILAFLINGGFALAESNPSNPITPGTNLGGENATAIGSGSVSAGSEASSIGTNTFASGNNMTKEEYLQFLKDNKERLSKIETKMQEIKTDKDEIQKLRQEHDDIINKIDRINNYKKAIEDKEKELNEKEPQILKTIEEKRTETIKFTKEIEDLNKRLNMINTLDVSKLNEDNLNSGITELAKDLKQKMETGSTFLKQYGENGIPLEQYENYIKSIVANKQQFYKNENFKVINNTNFQITDGILYTKDRKIKKYYISNNDNYNIVKDFFYEMSQAYITCDDTFDGFKQWIANKKNAKKYGYDGSYDIDRLEKVTEREFNEVKNNILNNNKINFDGKIIISDDELTNSDYDQLIEYGGTHGYYAQAGVHYNKIYSQLNGTGDKGFHFDVHVPLHINEQNKDEILHRLIKEPVIRYAATISKINSILKEKGLLYNKIADLTPIAEDSVGSMDDFTFNTINYIREDLYVKDGINYKAIDWLKENVNNIKQAINSKKNIDCKDKNLCILKDEFVKNEIKNQFNIMKTKCAEYEKLTNDNLDNEKFAALMIFYAGFAVPKDIYSGYNYNLSNDSKLSYDKQWEYEGTLKGVIDYLVPGLININYKKTLVTDKLINILNKENDRLKTIDDSKKFIKIYQNEIDRLKRLERDANTYITEKEELIKGYKNDIENLKSLLNSENPSDVEEVNKQIQEKEEKIKKALADIENLKKNLTEIKPGTNALAYGTNSAALGKDSIAFGTNNIAINESSIAFGTNNFVNGNKSIALGYGHKVIGDRSVTLGDPNLIFGNDNFAIGNNIKIGTETQKVNNNLVFGTNITIDGISNAIVFGDKSKAVEGAVSFGNDTTARKLKYIAEGKDNTDAVNIKQLKDYVRQNLVNVQGADVNITNLLKNKVDKTEYDTEIKNINNKITDGLKTKLDKDGTNLDKESLDKLTNKLSGESDISKPNNRLVTDTKIKQYFDTNFKIQNYAVAKEVLDIKKDAVEASAKAGLALGGVANAIAMANLTTTESGIANLTAAYGTYGKEHALAIGFNGTIPNRRFNYKFGLSTNMKGNLGIGAGVGFVIGGTTEQRQTQQERKIKALEKQLQEMSEILKKLQLKNNEKTKKSIEKH